MKPHEQTWHRQRGTIVDEDGERLLMSVTMAPLPVDMLDLATAAPLMARALLGLGGSHGEAASWHLNACWTLDSGSECSPECIEARAALQAAGVGLT